MRNLVLFSLATSVFLLIPSASKAQNSLEDVFLNDLSLGSNGQEVLDLQELLNRDPETQIANDGPGSPGNETTYFGSLTQAAVIRFQNKYASETLAPAGIALGTGFVGTYTRLKLNRLSEEQNAITQEVQDQMSPTGAAVPPPINLQTNVTTNENANPNQALLPSILADIETVGAKQGTKASAIKAAQDAVTKQLATSTDLRAAFIKQVTSTKMSLAPQSQNLLARIDASLGNIFLPRIAHAAIGLPFGGLLLAAVPCNGGIWNVYITPLPPTLVVTLSYLSGSQLFSSYNIPFTSSMLGFYEPGPGACVIGTVPVPAEGYITPFVGSAPI
jgi:peptidoglycan hydrolase-like protein with peptidoglycan-binding domain